LPWGIGAAIGALGLSVFFAEFQIWFLILSVALLLVGLFQLLRKPGSCRRRSRTEIVWLSIATVVVIAIVLFPQWVAGLFIGHLP
jgi:predicted nucleic acid-binding Zn ribbon protein